MKHSKNKKNWTKKKKGKPKTKQSEKKERKKKKRERQRQKGYPPNTTHFPERFFTCNLSGSLSKHREDETFTLLKLCYLLSIIFF